MAYEVRISDWSSYVCSSDLAAGDMLGPRRLAAAERGVGDLFAQFVAQSAVMRGVGAEAFALRRKLRIENGRTHALALPCPTVAYPGPSMPTILRSEEHTSELQSLMRISYAVFCLEKHNKKLKQN